MAQTVDFSREKSQQLRAAALVDSKIPFPSHKIQKGTGKGPRVALLACGSYSPITYMHLRLFEQAKDYGNAQGLNIVAGFLSPVTDAYKKKGLVAAHHRVKMSELATESSDWIAVDTWESSQPVYQTTIVVLDHLHFCLNKNLKQGEEPIQVKLLCGADLLESMNKPGVWAPEDIEEIVSRYGIVVLERQGSDVRNIVFENDVLWKYQQQIHIIHQMIANDISSTKVRQFLARNMSIKYLTPGSVIKYINDNQLYR